MYAALLSIRCEKWARRISLHGMFHSTWKCLPELQKPVVHLALSLRRNSRKVWVFWRGMFCGHCLSAYEQEPKQVLWKEREESRLWTIKWQVYTACTWTFLRGGGGLTWSQLTSYFIALALSRSVGLCRDMRAAFEIMLFLPGWASDRADSCINGCRWAAQIKREGGHLFASRRC